MKLAAQQQLSEVIAQDVSYYIKAISQSLDLSVFQQHTDATYGVRSSQDTKYSHSES